MKWMHNLLKGASLTGALFVFQACYGMVEPPLMRENGVAPMSFSLVSAKDGSPIEGVQITAKMTKEPGTYDLFGITGADGLCRVSLPYYRNQEGPFIHFESADGLYESADTSLADLRERTIVVKLKPVEP